MLLLGTSGEPAIQAITEDPLLLEIDFGRIDEPGVIAGTASIRPGFEDAGKRVIIVDNRYRREDPALLSHVLFHEAMHIDDESGREEETALVFIGELVHMEAQVDFPEIGRMDTALSQITRTIMLAALFNSLTPLESRGELFPGGMTDATATSLFYDSSYDSILSRTTPGSEYLLLTLRNLGLEFYEIPDYSLELLEQLSIPELIDSPETPVSAGDLVGIAERNGIELD